MPISSTIGFRDLRTAAELLLAPRPPATRSVVNSNSLKLNLGGDAMPGSITDPAQITGSIRSTFANAIGAKSAISSVLGSISTVLSGFDTHLAAFKAGTFVPPMQAAPVSDTGVPNVTGFFQFSLLTPGQSIPASFNAIIAQRKKQLQQLVAGFSSVRTQRGFGGLTLTENYQPTPYPHADQVDNPSTPRLAQGGSAAQADAILTDKIRFTVKGVPIAVGKPTFWSRLLNAAQVLATPGLNSVVNQVFKSRDGNGSWSEPTTPYAAQFPYNKVQQTESGHVMEFDDTPGAERVHMFHRAGSFIEMHPDGTVVYKTMKDGYTVVMGDNHVKVNGNCHVAVDGNVTLYVKGDAHIQSDKDVNVQTKGDFNVYATNINLRAKKTAKLDGMMIDLRYVKLPSSIVPLPIASIPGLSGGPLIVNPVVFLPLVSLAALQADFPDAGIGSGSSKAGAVVQIQIPDIVTPPINPLSNPAIYTTQTPQSVTYRARLFDTPEEVNDFELYSSHAQLQAALGDIPTGSDPKQLSGTLRTIPTTIVTPLTKPNVTYLNYDDYKGTYAYANTYALGNTSFTLQDVTDMSIHPDIATPLPTVDYVPPTGSFTNPDGGDGSSGGGSGDGGGNAGGAGEKDRQDFLN